GVVTSLRDGGNELLTFFGFPKAQWKTLQTTNTIERLHEEFRRRVMPGLLSARGDRGAARACEGPVMLIAGRADWESAHRPWRECCDRCGGRAPPCPGSPRLCPRRRTMCRRD